MNYTEVNIELNAEFSEILMAELTQIGYETFIDTEAGFQAYIPEHGFDEALLKEVFADYSDKVSMNYTLQTIEQQNWNAVWEADYEPVRIDTRCIIKSTFHQIEEKYLYEIIITPKMSFGTGHHETTQLMIEHQLELDHEGKKVLDAGSGTGVLAIMAEKLGAIDLMAIDIDEWAYTNSLENLELNATKCIQVKQSDIKNAVLTQKYDIILANINKNVLLEELPVYKEYLKQGAYLLMSGFYIHDSDDIVGKAESLGIKKLSQKEKNQWTAILFQNE